MLSRNLCLLILVYIQIGCLPKYVGPPQKKEYPIIKHLYEINVIDIDGIPLEEVTLVCKLTDRLSLVDSSKYITKSDGKISLGINASSAKQYESYSTMCSYVATKKGYYTGRNYMFNREGNKDSIIKVDKLTLLKPLDYINKDFEKRLTEIEFKKSIIEIIDTLNNYKTISNSYLDLNSVNLLTFKDKKYLSFKFVNTVSYNSIQKNKYDIGKSLFDDVVRKILTPLSETITQTNNFDGFDLTIIGHTRNFADKYATDSKVEYKFIIPNKTSQEYKNKDISGQKVLDSSIILMDNERIELKLD